MPEGIYLGVIVPNLVIAMHKLQRLEHRHYENVSRWFALPPDGDGVRYDTVQKKFSAFYLNQLGKIVMED